MINEANEPSSACRLWRIPQVETSTPPKAKRLPISYNLRWGSRNCWRSCRIRARLANLDYDGGHIVNLGCILREFPHRFIKRLDNFRGRFAVIRSHYIEHSVAP